MQTVSAMLGLSEAADRISFHVEEQSISGYDCPVSVPDDVRILLAPSVTGDGLTTVFHELGHGLASAANEADGLPPAAAPASAAAADEWRIVSGMSITAAVDPAANTPSVLVA